MKSRRPNLLPHQNRERNTQEPHLRTSVAGPGDGRSAREGALAFAHVEVPIGCPRAAAGAHLANVGESAPFTRKPGTVASGILRGPRATSPSHMALDGVYTVTSVTTHAPVRADSRTSTICEDRFTVPPFGVNRAVTARCTCGARLTIRRPAAESLI